MPHAEPHNICSPGETLLWMGEWGTAGRAGGDHTHGREAGRERGPLWDEEEEQEEEEEEGGLLLQASAD